MNPEEMGLKSLEKYSIFLNFIREKAELFDCFDFLCIGHEDDILKNGIANLGFPDYDSIFWALVHNDIITKHFYADNGNLFLTLDKNKFYRLCSDVDTRLSFLKENSVEKITSLSFDSENSVLIINNFKIKISKRKNDNYAHDLLKVIFERGPTQQFFYSELLEPILGITEARKDLWRTIYRACEDIQRKVQEGTHYKITDFLEFSSGIRGSVQIRSKYLPL